MRREELFVDRRDAGRQLAQHLLPLRQAHPVVLGLPRGGVVVAFEIARALGAPLDVLVARKLGAPMQPELGIGAIAPGGVMLVDRHTVKTLRLSDEEIDAVAQKETVEMERRLQRYRGSSGLPAVRGRTAILVDDGLATGVTALAAIWALRTQEPGRLVLAVPVCARETAEWIAEEVDELYCLSTPDRFRAVGLWYENFEQTSDAEVIELLEEARSHISPEEIQEP